VSLGAHAFVERLTALRMAEAQAEVSAEARMPRIDDRLARKDDLADLGDAQN